MNDCCENLANRAPGSGPRGGEEQEGLTITHCLVCGCRHFELTVDLGMVGVAGTGL